MAQHEVLAANATTRRSALTSAFEELAMQSETFQERDAGEGFSAHVRFDSSGTSSPIGRPTTPTHRGPSFGAGGAGTGGGGGGFADGPTPLRLSQSELDGMYRPSSLSGQSSMLDVDPEEMARSAGRQHGSFSCLSVLSEERPYPIDGGSLGAGAWGEQGLLEGIRGGGLRGGLRGGGGGGGLGGVGRGGARGGGGGGGGGGVDENVNMAFPFNSRTAAPDDSESTAAAARGVDIHRGAAPTVCAGAAAAEGLRGSGGGGGDGGSRGAGGGARAGEAALRGGSTHGVAGERALSFAANAAAYPHRAKMLRMVVVHPSHDEDENCITSAGQKQRGSFNSMLLLEAHELSMREDPLERQDQVESNRRLSSRGGALDGGDGDGDRDGSNMMYNQPLEYPSIERVTKASPDFYR